jgi:hypothetical protein
MFQSAGGRVFTDAIVAESAEIPDISMYRIGKAENIAVEGRLIPETRVERPPAAAIPRLREMNTDGVLPGLESR